MYVKKLQKANCVLPQLLGGFLGLSSPPGQNSISVKCTAVTRYTKVFFQLICALAFFKVPAAFTQVILPHLENSEAGLVGYI